MKTSRPRRQISIRAKLSLYLLGFVVVSLALLWLFHVVFLESFYRSIKEKHLRAGALSAISQIQDSSDIDDTLEKIAAQEGVSFALYNADGVLISCAGTGPQNSLGKLSAQSAQALRHKVLSAEDPLVDLTDEWAMWSAAGKSWQKEHQPVQDLTPRLEEQLGEDGGLPQLQERVVGPTQQDSLSGKGGVQTMLWGGTVQQQNKSYMLLASAVITPVSSTREAIQTELVYISLVLVALSILLAWLLSKKITSPIVLLNSAAKKLAAADSSASFYQTGYREIAELSQTLEHTASELQKIERLRRELIANISHDLRTPLTLITGYGEVMRDLPGENTPENLQVIIDEARRLSSLVTDTLDLSQLQAGVQTLSTSPFDLTQLVQNVVTRYGAMLKEQGYQLQFDRGGSDEGQWVEADENKIYQVVYNLVGNAVTYTGADKQVLVRQRVQGDMVTIEVLDTGEGIEPQMLPHIWERYYNGESAHKRPTAGTGLGLSIVKGCLELHHTPYGVKSEPGLGSCFWFSLKRL